MSRYNSYGTALKSQYGEKVYRIPIQLPLTCPNRDGTVGEGGCIFCGEGGVDFESMPSDMSIRNQLEQNINYIGKRYNAKRFISYFQNYTNTYMELQDFKRVIQEAIREDVVAIAVSTRPDCIQKEQLDFLAEVAIKHDLNIIIEMGLQSVQDKTLKILNRGHTCQDFIDAMELIGPYHFEVVVHMILDLPWDTNEDIIQGALLLSKERISGVKLHSLYILKNTVLGQWFEEKRFKMGDVEVYVNRCTDFLTHLRKEVVVQRIAGRAPEEETLFCNYGMSWWRIKDLIEEKMEKENLYQGMFWEENKEK